MFELVLIIVGIILFIALLPYIVAIAIIAGVIALIIFLVPKIWAFCKPFLVSVIWPFLRSVPSYIFLLLKWIFPFLPYILGGILVLSLGVYISNRIKYGAKIAELNRRGIEISSYFGTDAEALVRIGEAKATADGYIISSKFYRSMTGGISQAKILSQDEIRDYCLRYANKFQVLYLQPLLAYLYQQKACFPFPGENNAHSYLSQGFVRECTDLFEKEGAATRKDLIRVFENSPVTDALRQEGSGLATFILDYLVLSGQAEKIKLSNSGENLYVTKNLQSGSKLVRREISID